MITKTKDKESSGVIKEKSFTMKTVHGKYDFVCTSIACPEQYEVFNRNINKVSGYIRLRYGILRCDYPECGSETIYLHGFDDKNKGCFDDDDERFSFLHKCLIEIIKTEAKVLHVEFII